jgi:uncharacterized protein
VEANGDVAHCDEFVGDPRYTVGNVLRQTFADMRKSPVLHVIHEENEAALASMQRCPEFAVCNGACPHERYLRVRHDLAYSPACCGWRALIEHIREGEQSKAQAGPERSSLVATSTV